MRQRLYNMRHLLAAVSLFVLRLATATLESALTTDGSGVSRVYFASYKLPDINYKHPPEGCDDFDDICPLERKGKIGQAIQAYEDRLSKYRSVSCSSYSRESDTRLCASRGYAPQFVFAESGIIYSLYIFLRDRIFPRRHVTRACMLSGRCGVVGWSKLGHLGAGKAAIVSLRVTPCGKHVAVKGTHNPAVVQHVIHDCKVLMEINNLRNNPCPECFPEVYYLSNMTSACFVEHVPSVPITKFLDHFRANGTTARLFREMKLMFSQGIDALKVLRFSISTIRFRPQGDCIACVCIAELAGSANAGYSSQRPHVP